MENVIEKLGDVSCDYCSIALESGWCSEWCENHDQHYKSLKCSSCGHKNWLKVDFRGSGHDRVFSHESPLESTVKKVRSI